MKLKQLLESPVDKQLYEMKPHFLAWIMDNFKNRLTIECLTKLSKDEFELYLGKAVEIIINEYGPDSTSIRSANVELGVIVQHLDEAQAACSILPFIMLSNYLYANQEQKRCVKTDFVPAQIGALLKNVVTIKHFTEVIQRMKYYIEDNSSTNAAQDAMLILDVLGITYET